MILKKTLLIFLFFQFSKGSKDCTISDVLLNQYDKGHYGFYVGQRLEIANSSVTFSTKYYVVTMLAYYGNCLGFSTENLNTIILDCPDQNAKKSGCFLVLKPQFDNKSNAVSFIGKEENVCVTKLNESCIGLKINDDMKLILDSRFCRSSVEYVGIQYTSLTIEIPENRMPPGV